MSLGPETLIFTKKGIVKIADIERQHLLWDGYTWVDHGGRIYDGFRDCIEFQSIRITPEHIVLCEDEWHEVSDMKDSLTLRNQTIVEPPYLYMRPIGHCWSVSPKKDIPMYNIMNSGAQRRFTILTAKGPVVVHNCERT